MSRRVGIPLAIAGGVVVALGALALVVRRAESKVDRTALADDARPVTVIVAEGARYRPSRGYVGTLEPWLAASVGPQRVAAYVDAVLVRPGAEVKRGDVLATLDCQSASATTRAVAMQARALEARHRAIASEASRIQGLLDGGFVSPNEAERKQAESASEEAQLLATQARLVGASLEVNDCVLRAPFAGEIAARTADPGAFVRPGGSIVSVVDRTTVRVVGDAPEVDFAAVAPGVPARIRILAGGRTVTAPIARRAPAADGATRTVHFEIDLPDADRSLPVGTTAEVHVDVGSEIAATAVPLSAATVRGARASVFVVEGDVARVRVVKVVGEREGRLFLDPELAPGARVVSEGRALLSDGDRVRAAAAADAGAPR